MDFEAFAALHYPALSRDEVRHNVPLAILKRGLRDAALQIRFWTLGGPGCTPNAPQSAPRGPFPS